ncbi:unnamed protein product [Hydatigera taeniaeformis]|uniref:Intraflagellar transport protein 43 homolog n=1 Tax=Hydatigena taeniaeformis TaxID=6205 RepID=A0A0R3WKK4_HYDTA|nr:unnamed protein product [Hydatigera taeniaeformis]
MSAVCEVTEPLSERVSGFDPKMQHLAVCKDIEILSTQNSPTAWQIGDVSDVEESEEGENIPITPEDQLLRSSQSLASRMERLLWAPIYSPSNGLSDDSDGSACSSSETSPPIMRLYTPKGGHRMQTVSPLTHEHLMQWKSTQTETVPLTIERGTQTAEEFELPVYPDVIDNQDANRLKEWIEELFRHKLPREDSHQA